MGKTAQVVASIVLFFGTAKVALAEPSPTTPSNVRDLQVSDIVIPPELGYIIETHEPSFPNAPAIIHIQEAHTNYEAQQHLIGILERLIQQWGLKLILVEGGQGDVSLAYLRSYGPPENRRQVAEKYLKLGVISAEEYLDIVSEYPLLLWGVEQKDLYQQNVEAFLQAESLQHDFTPVLASVRQAVEQLKPHLFDPVLIELEAKGVAFDGHQLGLADYVGFLSRVATRSAVQLETSPQVARFLAVHELEQAIRPEQVQQEQRALMAQLSQRIPEAELNELLANARETNTGTQPRLKFYEHLERLMATAGLELRAFPHLSRYLRYLRRSAQLKPAELAEELKQLAARLRRLFASASPQSQQLATIAEELGLVERLLNLQLSPDEYEQVQAAHLETRIPRWAEFLNDQLPRQGFATSSFAGLDTLGASLPVLRRFYEAAGVRDQALVNNALAKLAQTQEPLAVLITGGFHAPLLTQLFTEKGIGLVVMAPKIEHDTNEQLYRAVLKYKNGHGTLRDVEAAAAASGAFSSPGAN